ncbi:MAG: hypothetical protein HQM03_21020 [Magnetococcales bacterium]|nr:hypothetical protein [Magnetococcales bacterium]
MPWKYDPGEWRKKHKWNKDEAGFHWEGQEEIGKCPTSITRDSELAEELLNKGIGYPDAESPEAIYNIHQGVVYRAEVTLPGVSFHGFPEKEQKRRRVPTAVLLQLAHKAQNDGTFHLFKDWMRAHLPEGWKAIASRFRQTGLT